MAINSDYSTPATGDDAVFSLKQFAKSNGWSVSASGDGIPAGAYNATGDVHTTAASLGTAGAWFLLKMGVTTRCLLFVRKSSSTAWTIKYSPLGYAGGAANSLPSSAASNNLIDGTWLGTDGTYRWLLAFEDVAPYGFWAAALTIGTLAAVSAVALLSMEPGSADSNDDDPYIAIAPASSVFSHGQLWQAENSAYVNFHGWYRYGKGAAGWVAVPFASLAFGQGNIGAEGTIVSLGLLSSENGQEVTLPIISGFRHTKAGVKGLVRGARWASATTGTAPNGTHLTDGGTRYWVRVGDLWLQWDAIVPSL